MDMKIPRQVTGQMPIATVPTLQERRREAAEDIAHGLTTIISLAGDADRRPLVIEAQQILARGIKTALELLTGDGRI